MGTRRHRTESSATLWIQLTHNTRYLMCTPLSEDGFVMDRIRLASAHG
jgi:hypothetical protein